MRALRTTLAFAALLLAPRAAMAATSCGAVITNTATITMWSGPIDQIGYEVSYNVTATVRVICPVTAVLKYARPAEVAATGVTTFYICIDNQRMSSDGSVWNVTVTDRLSDGMGFVAFNPQSYVIGGGAVLTSSWAASLAGPWTVGSPVAGQQDPLFLRWVISYVGTLKSGCVTFSASVL
jgi:hypothetical protein